MLKSCEVNIESTAHECRMNRNCHAGFVELQNWCCEMTSALAANSSDFFLKIGFGSTDLTPGCLWKGTGGEQNPKRWEKRETIPNSVHCHHLNGLCIKMGSRESHFNVSLIVRVIIKVTIKVFMNYNFWRGRRAEVDSNEVLLFTSLTPYHQAKPGKNFLSLLNR